MIHLRYNTVTVKCPLMWYYIVSLKFIMCTLIISKTAQFQTNRNEFIKGYERTHKFCKFKLTMWCVVSGNSQWGYIKSLVIWKIPFKKFPFTVMGSSTNFNFKVSPTYPEITQLLKERQNVTIFFQSKKTVTFSDICRFRQYGILIVLSWILYFCDQIYFPE